MSNQHVLVTYASPPPFQNSEGWKQVLAALRSQLPLRNIHWKSTSRPNIRTIQELDIALVALDSFRDEHTSQIPVTLLEKPLLNLYIVTCEDNDTYRTTVKKQIKDWHSSVTQRKNQEWLLIHVVRPDTRTPDRKFFNMKGSVLDKIKADFNVDKRDRCVQLAWSPGEHNPAIWADLLNKFKDGLLSALDSTVSQREEEVKRSEGQRQMPGWNFCTFFILKESLANSFEGVHLFEDALIHYNELENSFIQVLRDKNLSWFGSLIHPAPKDDSAPLLSVTKKPYRDLILANSISIFDFRIYLLGRQCSLLNKLKRPTEICRKTTSFLATFSRRLRDVETILPEYFIESWIFSSALSVVDQCETWAQTLTLSGSALALFNASKGELLELAKSQLDVLGVKVGHLPSKPPFSMALPTLSIGISPSNSHKRSSTQRISKYELMLAIGEQDAFYDLYCVTSNRAIDMYVKAGRRKFALKLHGSLAALDVHRGRLGSALTIFSSLPAHYAPHMWTSLESFMLSRAMDTHAKLDKPHDREWIHILLAFLKTYINDTTQEVLMPEEDMRQYVTQLVGALTSAAHKLDSDLAHPDHPALCLQVGDDAQCVDGEDMVSLDVTVRNNLPCDLFVNEIKVTLSGRDTHRLVFCTKLEKFPPGKTALTLLCPTSSSGTFVLDSSEAKLSHLHFQWNHKRAGSSQKNRPTLIRIPKNIQALDVRLSQPQCMELGTTSKFLVTLATGRNDITRATVTLSAPTGMQIKYSGATVESERTEELEVSDTSLALSNLAKDRDVVIAIPHSDASRYHAMKIDIGVTYRTVEQPLLDRSLQTSRVVTVSLPIAVNVEDFFRSKRLFSKFAISTTTHQHVRILSARLASPKQGLEGIKITCYRHSHPIITVTPEHAANFLFSIESAHGPVSEPLQLVVKYRMLREEVQSLILEVVNSATSHITDATLHRQAFISKLVEYLESDAEWVPLYGITGELNIPDSLKFDGELEDTFHSIRTMLARKRSLDSFSSWREIKIPVDVPRANIVAAARIGIHPTPFSAEIAPYKLPPTYAGQPISCTLNVITSFHWSEGESKNQRYVMRYDVEEMVKDWLVCGRKRGDFVAMDGATFSVHLTLIALRHGELALPKVNIRPLPLTNISGMGSINLPTADTHQMHGAEKIMILPRGGRSTFVVGMGNENP
ncbi:trafficking protein particle complex subunit 10 [Hygrophoropsis aurantiaca]|uniref:Trafficking protein particle complex subunit 10 n=1 Tax=Hygrophoropsis aurantiaca TaxID=72124 RepID=A0ACB8ANZ1_9AGAM|nr:trafficking protein particle complex subunit 10 [Hygrophoropsis aurantiaca]